MEPNEPSAIDQIATAEQNATKEKRSAPKQVEPAAAAAKLVQKPPKLPPAIMESDRPPLTEEVFLNQVLNWQVRWLRIGGKGLPVTKYNMQRIPYSFDSIDQYHDIFKPLVFAETWEEVRSQIGARSHKWMLRLCFYRNSFTSS